MNHDVFISYSSKNAEYANEVCEKLENNGIECWIDSRSIETGTNYANEIVEGLNFAKIVVLVFSKDAQESEYVNNEIDAAFSSNKRIVAFKIDDSFPEKKMQFFLKNTQWLDASPTTLKEKNKTLESCYDQLVYDVKRILGEIDSGQVTSTRSHHEKIAPQKTSFFDKYKLPIIAVAIILIAVVGFTLFSGMGSDSTDEESNETGISIGYIGVESYGENDYTYYVFGSIEDTNSTKDTVHIDYKNKDDKIIDTSDTKVGDVEGNILGSVDVNKNDIVKVSAELKDKNDKVIYNVESDNIIEQ